MGRSGQPALVRRLRWRIGTLVGLGVLNNHFGRISLSVAAPQLGRWSAFLRPAASTGASTASPF